jgi:hypothetical protein
MKAKKLELLGGALKAYLLAEGTPAARGLFDQFVMISTFSEDAAIRFWEINRLIDYLYLFAEFKCLTCEQVASKVEMAVLSVILRQERWASSQVDQTVSGSQISDEQEDDILPAA